MTSGLPAGANRLYFEKSPYLKQHAFNPVDWHPWGEEAFEKARREDKPILLSIGYSTCHWCHVMEHESFSKAAAASVMNQWVVPIKLDREERPDIDRVYMTAVSALTGQGGWPLNVFLTPDLKPFYGGTYFPPQPAYGRPSWTQIVEAIGKAWKDPKGRETILSDSAKITEAVREMGRPGEPSTALRPAWLDQAFASFVRAYDDELGGFGQAPKFPMPVNQTFLLRYALRARRHGREDDAKSARDMALATLRHMAQGGIHDHLGGGFARYSTDERWHVPHFEKMLYDNAQLAVNYVEAWQASGEAGFKETAKGIFSYVLRDLSSPQGGFYSAEDADSLPAADADRKVEGAFYVWKQEEVLGLLGEAGGAFCEAYDVREDGNVAHDPHGEFGDKNVLFALDLDALSDGKMAASREILLQARSQRPRPHRDEKILASWNGLMISALAKGWQAMQEPAWLEAATRAADFVLGTLFDRKARILHRRWAEGERAIEGGADDYAFCAAAMLDLYECLGEEDWLEAAMELSSLAQEYFFDPASGAYFMTRQGSDPSLLARFQENQDNVEPSAASVASMNLLRLWLFTGEESRRSAAESALRALGPVMEKSPRAAAAMLSCLDLFLSPPIHAVVLGSPDSPLAARARAAYQPRRALVLLEPQKKSRLPLASEFKLLDQLPTAYVCVDMACQLPTTDPEAAAAMLEGAS